MDEHVSLVEALTFNGVILWVITFHIGTLLLKVNKGAMHGLFRSVFELSTAYLVGYIPIIFLRFPENRVVSPFMMDFFFVATLLTSLGWFVLFMMQWRLKKSKAKMAGMPGFYLGYLIGIGVVLICVNFLS